MKPLLRKIYKSSRKNELTQMPLSAPHLKDKEEIIRLSQMIFLEKRRRIRL